MEAKFYDSLFGGDSANGVKLCLGLTEGDFWTRTSGAQFLYGGQNDEVDFDTILAALNIDEDTLEITSGEPSSSFLYVLRRANLCGIEEKTLSAAVRADFDSLGNLSEYGCNKIFLAAAEQIEGNKILLKWFYQPIHQSKKVEEFKIYFDNGTGSINYQSPLGSVKFEGRKFYQFITNGLSGSSYKFCIRAVSGDLENNFNGQIIIQLNKQAPDGVSTIICQTE